MSIHSDNPNSAAPTKVPSQALESSPRKRRILAAGSNRSFLRAAPLIKRRQYDLAAALLSTAGRDLRTRNTLGVCWMRTGAVDEAVQLFRTVVLLPGSVQERFDLDDLYKRNFAVALLLNGLPSGALSVLAHLRDPDHMAACRVRFAINSWADSLPWLKRLNWKINRIEPANCKVPIDFEPGEFDFDFAGISRGEAG